MMRDGMFGDGKELADRLMLDGRGRGNVLFVGDWLGRTGRPRRCSASGLSCGSALIGDGGLPGFSEILDAELDDVAGLEIDGWLEA